MQNARCIHLYTGGTLNQCQMRCPSWPKDILLGVTVSLLESEALCAAAVAISVYSPLTVNHPHPFRLLLQCLFHSYFIVIITSARIANILVDVVVCMYKQINIRNSPSPSLCDRDGESARGTGTVAQPVEMWAGVVERRLK